MLVGVLEDVVVGVLLGVVVGVIYLSWMVHNEGGLHQIFLTELLETNVHDFSGGAC